MKVAIFLATYNKEHCLSNTLYSIARQKTSFPVEVCIIDDASRQDPEPIIKQFDLTYKYLRLGTNVGVKKAQSFCLDLVSDDVDVIVLQSSDVLYVQDNALEELCTNVKSKIFTLAEVRDIEVDPLLYQNFDQCITFYSSEDALQQRIKEGPSHWLYSGSHQPQPKKRWYFFLGAILKENLLEAGFRDNCFDKALSDRLHDLDCQPLYLDNLMGIHQKHHRDKDKGYNA